MVCTSFTSFHILDALLFSSIAVFSYAYRGGKTGADWCKPLFSFPQTPFGNYRELVRKWCNWCIIRPQIGGISSQCGGGEAEPEPSPIGTSTSANPR